MESIGMDQYLCTQKDQQSMYLGWNAPFQVMDTDIFNQLLILWPKVNLLESIFTTEYVNSSSSTKICNDTKSQEYTENRRKDEYTFNERRQTFFPYVSTLPSGGQYEVHLGLGLGSGQFQHQGQGLRPLTPHGQLWTRLDKSLFSLTTSEQNCNYLLCVVQSDSINSSIVHQNIFNLTRKGFNPRGGEYSPHF